MWNLAKIEFDGHAYGCIFTEVEAHTETNIIKVQQCDVATLGQLAADVLGEDQPDLVSYAVHNLAKWIIRYGAQRYGAHLMLHHTARALARHQTREHYE